MGTERPPTKAERCGKSEGLRIRELEDRVSTLESAAKVRRDISELMNGTSQFDNIHERLRRLEAALFEDAKAAASKPATFIEAWQWMMEGGVVRQRGYLYKIEDGVLFYSVRAGSWRQEEKVYPETFLFGDWTLLPREGA